MYALDIVLFCSVVGTVVCYNVQREIPYNVGPNDPYAVDVNPNINEEQLQRIFWGSGGSNQVGGNQNLWDKITNKFPFLENIFGRMELPPQYNDNVQQQYGVPSIPQQYGAPNVQQQYGVPSIPQQYGVPEYYQPRYYQRQYHQQFLPSARDVAFTDDAVIVTPPQVPVFPQPVPQPIPQPLPQPIPVHPIPEPSGYQYNKPQNRLELPHK